MNEINSKSDSEHYDIILFDGVCNLCNHAVHFIIDRDPKGRYRFASLQSEVGHNQLQKHGLPSNQIDSLVLIRNGHTYIKSTGALYIARHLSGLWPLSFAFIIIPSPLRNFLYDLLAKYRYKIFGRSDSCRYPTNELKLRFLDY